MRAGLVVRAVAAATATTLLVSGCVSGEDSSDGASELTLLTPAENAIIRDSLAALAKDECKSANDALPLKSSTVAQADVVQKITLLAGQGALPVMFVAGTAQVRPTGDLGKGDLVLDYEKTLKDLGVWDNVLPAAAATVKNVYGSMASLPFQYNIEGIYYNKALFAKNNVAPPETWDQFVAASQKFKAAGVVPVTEAGSEGWPITRLVGNYIFRSVGPDAMKAVQDGKAKLTDPQYVAGADAIAKLGKAGLFGEGITSRTTDAANAQFLTGQAAMTYTGSWFLSNLNDEAQNKIGAENVGFIPFPAVTGGKGDINQWPSNAGAPTALHKQAYTKPVGEWLKCIAENFGSTAMQDQGVISGFKTNQPVTDVKPLTAEVQKRASESTESVLWFEALMDAKTTKDAQTNAALLLTGELTPQKYMELLQKDLDQAS